MANWKADIVKKASPATGTSVLHKHRGTQASAIFDGAHGDPGARHIFKQHPQLNPGSGGSPPWTLVIKPKTLFASAGGTYWQVCRDTQAVGNALWPMGRYHAGTSRALSPSGHPQEGAASLCPYSAKRNSRSPARCRGACRKR